MHTQNLAAWQHQHRFHNDNRSAERNTMKVIWLTLIMMIVEIFAGLLTGSMALLADGWHMGTHFFALGITVFAYAYARKHADNPSYSFGTGKVDVLGGFTSAVVLGVVALAMIGESVHRIFAPENIHFNEALLVAVIGLVVNLVSALLLHGSGHGHGHAHGHSHAHDHSPGTHHHHDHNLKAAYLHVIADALTSVLAIVALLAGKAFGWVFLDPVMGIVGALVISRWAYGLLRDTGKILLDHNDHQKLSGQIKTLIEADADNRVADLHLWNLSANKLASIISVVTHHPQPPNYYKDLLQELPMLEHVTVEVHGHPGEPCIEAA